MVVIVIYIFFSVVSVLVTCLVCEEGELITLVSCFNALGSGIWVKFTADPPKTTN